MKPKFIIKAYNRQGELVGEMTTHLTEWSAREACGEVLRMNEKITYVELHHWGRRFEPKGDEPIVILPELPF